MQYAFRFAEWAGGIEGINSGSSAFISAVDAGRLLFQSGRSTTGHALHSSRSCHPVRLRTITLLTGFFDVQVFQRFVGIFFRGIPRPARAFISGDHPVSTQSTIRPATASGENPPKITEWISADAPGPTSPPPLPAPSAYRWRPHHNFLCHGQQHVVKRAHVAVQLFIRRICLL